MSGAHVSDVRGPAGDERSPAASGLPATGTAGTATGRVPAGHYRLSGLLRAEWTKLRTVRSTPWSYGLVAVLGVGLAILATAETRAHWSTLDLVQRATFDPTRTSLVGVFFGQLVVGVLGVLVVSAEYGTGTIRATFAAAPRRPLVLVAKAAVFGAVTLVVSEAVALVSFLVGQALLTSPATHATLGTAGAARAVFGSGLYLCLLGLVALALGTIVRHTAGAIGAFVAVLLVLPIIVGVLPSSIGNAMQRFLPAEIGRTMISLRTPVHDFGPWPGLAVLAVYAVVLLAVAGALLVRRDA